MPLREAFHAVATHPAPGRGGRIGVLLTSGSRGEAFLAREAPALLAATGAGFSFEVVHQTGGTPPDEVLRAYRAQQSLDATVAAVPFVDDMAAAYRRAHLAIARGGAGTLAELAAAGLPAIVVPLPDASDDHQTVNARQFEAAGAGLCVPEPAWSREAPVAWMRTILNDPSRWQDASSAAQRLATPGAASRMVTDCLTLMR